MVVSRTQFLPLLLNTGLTYFATQSLDKAGNWEEGPDGDGDTWVYYTASSGSPGAPGAQADGHSGIEPSGGGCFVSAAAPEVVSGH